MPRELAFEAGNLRTFIPCLRRIGRKVGPRSGLARRNKEDKEQFCFRRYALTLATHRMWRFPCKVSMGERPDFMVTFGSKSHGVEVTEATTELFQRDLTRSERCGSLYEDMDDGWVGDGPEQAWCKAVVDAIEAKVRLIGGYRPAARHDILIYSNHPTDSVRGMGGRRPEYDRLQSFAQQRVESWKREPSLGIISIIDGSTLLYDLTGRFERWPVVDLRDISQMKNSAKNLAR
jgi:hypothetical protein